jgi:hypothetical protein
MIDLEKVKETIDDLSTEAQVALWNEYCEANNYMDDYIEHNNPNELFIGLTPEEILDRVHLGGKYSNLDVYATMDGYGEYVSFDYADDDNSPFDLDSVAQWCYDEEDGRGYFDIDDCDDGE